MKCTARVSSLLGAALLLAASGSVSAGDGWRTLSAPQLPRPSPPATSRSMAPVSTTRSMVPATQMRCYCCMAASARRRTSAVRSRPSPRVQRVAIGRGHGRSTDDDQPYGYHLMAGDVMGVMDSLGIAKAAVVGWSDGGNIGLDLAINNPDRLTKVFARCELCLPENGYHLNPKNKWRFRIASPCQVVYAGISSLIRPLGTLHTTDINETDTEIAARTR